jgi:beta-glucanase (GH16 family)
MKKYHACKFFYSHILVLNYLEFVIMKKNAPLQMLFAFFLVSQCCFAQVDVVYNDLVWSDEFDAKGAVNSNNWFHQTQLPAGGSWYNNEVQHYTDLETNSFVDAGFLNIIAKKENFTDQGVSKGYTSARLNSKFSFKYGRVDVRAKIPIEAGTWPAIWMLGKNVNEDGGYFDATYGTSNWPSCGEIDIMEHGITRSQPINYIQSALHTPSSYGNTTNIGGVEANSDIANNYHIYSMNWSPNQISFLLDNVIYYTYDPTVKDASTWPFDKEQYLLLNIAMGGVAGPISSTFAETSMVVDYVRVYQNTTFDTQAPTNFTVTIGTITGSSVELLLNATDNSGTVTYNVDYGSGTNSTSFSSGVQKSVIIDGLSPNTNYSFTVSARDASGNVYLNNPIILKATTTENTTTECAGTSSEASQNSFSVGYKYSFQTTGTDVKITFELLDKDKVGVVAYLWKQTPFSESQMSNVSGNIFTKTITGQSIGSTINYAVKFAYAGGLSVTKYFSYVVGSNCTLGTKVPTELTQFYYPNPVGNKLYLQLLDEQNHIILTNVLGQKLVEDMVKPSHILDMSDFRPGIYFLKVDNSRGIQNLKILKK